MLSLSLNIVITEPQGNYTLTFASAASVEIESSWKNLTDTAKITLPRNARLKNSVYDDINKVIVRGSRVEINIGYDGNMKREFTGYVAKVDAKTPFAIECADEMWKLKQTTFNKTWREVKLDEVIAFIYKGKRRVNDINLGSYRIKNVSAAKVLDELKDLGFYSYFRYDESLGDVVLCSGLGGYSFSASDHARYNFNRNVVENSLSYQLKEDMKLKVKAVSIQNDNTKVEVDVGDEGGDLRTFHCPLNLSKAEVKRYADENFQLLKVDGYKGNVTGFGIPFVKHGDVVNVEDDMFPERSGAYFANTVKVTFGTGGFRRNVELGFKASK